MRRILALRHAKAVEREEAQTDAARVLADRGRKDAAALGRALRTRGLAPDWILCSPAVRARETTDIVRSAMGSRAQPVVVDPMLTGGATEYLQALAACPPEVETVLMVGHNPATEEMAARLVGRSVSLKTCHVALLESDAPTWDAAAAPGACRLEAVLGP